MKKNTDTNNFSRPIYASHNNTLTGNTSSDNNLGVCFHYSSDNLIYNNNLIDNVRQAFDVDDSGNVFNLATGGNYWSDWTRPDKDADGFVDSPYVFSAEQDDLPWTAPNGWDLVIPREMLQLLTAKVAALNLPKGLVGKLIDAAKMLSDANPNNNGAAVNKLNDFINQVSSRADEIVAAGGDPDALIAETEAIIAMLETG